ncbi:hypothetical protein GGR57DRAFT_112815 [Xylariaceae sp. FL1272]|nr:hypothetical protein GGR57DRAFT_112815 [Xylariaceae sp. FL1272]
MGKTTHRRQIFHKSIVRERACRKVRREHADLLRPARPIRSSDRPLLHNNAVACSSPVVLCQCVCVCVCVCVAAIPPIHLFFFSSACSVASICNMDNQWRQEQFSHVATRVFFHLRISLTYLLSPVARTWDRSLAHCRDLQHEQRHTQAILDLHQSSLELLFHGN